jgi:hypothetical protein
MIATARSNDKFLELLPAIHEQAQFAFRGIRCEAREELVQETVAQAYVLFVRLVKRDKMALVYPTPLARFAIRRVRSGRRLGSLCNRRDITSPYNESSKKVTAERLDRVNLQTGDWQEVLLEDRTAGPAKIVEIRIDFAAWLRTLSKRNRRLAQMLGRGETTGRVARSFTISSARVSQLRRDLCRSWQTFVGEPRVAKVPSIAVA